MNYSEIRQKIAHLTKLNITNVELAKALNKSRSNLTYKITNNNEVSLEDFNKFAEYFNISKEDLMEDYKFIKEDIVSKKNRTLDYYPNIFGSCGNGCFILSEEKEKIKLPIEIMPCLDNNKKYSVINSYGNSMFPSIFDKDLIVVEMLDNKVIQDNQIYVFMYDNTLYTKRLVNNIDEIIIISDNPEYSKKHIKDKENIYLIGKVVARFTKYM